MGSIDKACISGFLCRLCSEMHRTVIHIYGDQGQKHGLVEKINGYLPITISPTDPLPKTICEACLRRVEQHYELLLRLAHYREHRISGKKELRPRLMRMRTVVRTEQDSATQTAPQSTSSSPETATTSTSSFSLTTSNTSSNVSNANASSSHPPPPPRRAQLDVASSSASTSSPSSTSDEDSESHSCSSDSNPRISQKNNRKSIHRPHQRSSRSSGAPPKRRD